MKITTLSDTHGFHRYLPYLPDTDLLIIAGDVTQNGSLVELEEFNQWLKATGLKKRQVIFVPGNHDRLFEVNYPLAVSTLSHCKVLCDRSLDVEGLKIYGSPITPRFGNWAFMRERGWELREMWRRIPEDVNILVTHGPPHGILDKAKRSRGNVGCESLRERVDGLSQMKLHLFGHVHESRGVTQGGKGEWYANVSAWDHDKGTIRGYTRFVCKEGKIHYLPDEMYERGIP